MYIGFNGSILDDVYEKKWHRSMLNIAQTQSGTRKNYKAKDSSILVGTTLQRVHVVGLETVAFLGGS